LNLHFAKVKILFVFLSICASFFASTPVKSRQPEPLRCEVYQYPRTCRVTENDNFLIIKAYLRDFNLQGTYTLAKNADGTFSDAEDGAVWRRKSSPTATTYYATKCSVFRGAKECIPFTIKIWNK